MDYSRERRIFYNINFFFVSDFIISEIIVKFAFDNKSHQIWTIDNDGNTQRKIYKFDY